MTGLPNSIAASIPKAPYSLANRGLPDGSYFEVEFEDGSTVSEHEANWSDLAHPEEVDALGVKKVAHTAKFRVKRISVFHNGLSTTIEVPEGCSPYQSVRAESVIGPGMGRIDRILGRVVGLVRNGQVIEERFLDGRERRVGGYRR